jgi:hypothetical protein
MSSLSDRPVATGIQTADLHLAWPGLWPLLKPAYDACPDKRDILAGLYSRDLQLWAVYASKIPLAGIVTCLNQVGTSGELHCRIWLVGGSRLIEWAADFIEKLKLWAKAEGCVEIDGTGRPGWARIVGRFGGEMKDRLEDGRPAWRLVL